MIAPSLTDASLLVLGAGGWLAAGAAIGAFHFLTLRQNVRMLAAGRPLLPALALQLARFAATAAALFLIARHFGALPLLAGTAGILASRTAIARCGARP
jgi:hypothetical protein